MVPQTIILMGRAGSGKGTQGALLREELLRRGGRTVFYLETGAKFREFVAGSSYSSKRARSVIERGGLMPSFLAVWNWGSSLLENMTGDEHLLVDGTPRMLSEAILFKEALKFYQRDPITFVYLNVSAAAVEQRLLLRGRSDDTPEAIANRLRAFETEVKPVIDHFRLEPGVRFIEVDGHPPIDVVRESLLSALNFNHGD